MNISPEIHSEYVYILNLLNEYNSDKIIDWSRIQNLLQQLYINPFNFSYVNELLGALVISVYNDICNKQLFNLGCPCEIARGMIYNLGCPPYYDNFKINTILQKYILNNTSCPCNHYNCIFKPAMPEMSFFIDYLQNNFT